MFAGVLAICLSIFCYSWNVFRIVFCWIGISYNRINEIRSSNQRCSAKKVFLRRAYTIKFFFHDLEFFFSIEKCENISGSEICVAKYYSVCSHGHTIKFHSCDHDNVSFIEKIKNFHFCECAMFIRDRRNTNWTKNIVMAASVTMNSTLYNPEVLDPLLKFVFKNWDIRQFIILLIIKKITLNYYPFPQLSSFFIL